MRQARYILLTPMPKGREVLPIGETVVLDIGEATYLEEVKAVEFVEFVQGDDDEDAPSAADIKYLVSKLPVDQVEALRQALGVASLTPVTEPAAAPVPAVSAEPVPAEPAAPADPAAGEPATQVPASAKPARSKSKPKSE